MLELTLPAMTRGHRVGVVTRAIQQADPAAVVQTDLARHLVRVETTASRQSIDAALTEAGYLPA